MRARVIGIGQASAGDDGVGLAVVEALRARGIPADIDVRHVSDPSALVALLDTQLPTVIVDGVLGSPAGEVVELGAEDLASRGRVRVSSHGLGVFEAVGLARVFHGADAPAVRIVAITIARPEGLRHALSPEVAAAVPAAAERVLSVVGKMGTGTILRFS